MCATYCAFWFYDQSPFQSHTDFTSKLGEEFKVLRAKGDQTVFLLDNGIELACDLWIANEHPVEHRIAVADRPKVDILQFLIWAGRLQNVELEDLTVDRSLTPFLLNECGNRQYIWCRHLENNVYTLEHDVEDFGLVTAETVEFVFETSRHGGRPLFKTCGHLKTNRQQVAAMIAA